MEASSSWMNWLLGAAAAVLIAFIFWTLRRRRVGAAQTINWETMGLTRLKDLRGGRGRNLSQKQREQLIWEALGSGDLDMMIRALDVPGYTPERHFIMSSIVSVTYGMRDESIEMRELCAEMAWKHLSEFPRLSRALKASGKWSNNKSGLPRVTTFQYLSTLLTERGEYEKAAEVCKKAISFDLSDGTKSGYEGRIKRIRLAQEKAETEGHPV